MAEDSISALSLSDSDPDNENDVPNKAENVHVNKPADEEDDKSGYTDDWQSGKDFIQTNLMMLECETLTDVTFEVGEEGEIIRAHKFMLASRSCVFFAMFCGPMAESGEIKITDIHPNNFQKFLRYLYTGVIALTTDNAINLLYCSKKYCVKILEQEVLEYCKSSICADNACTLLEQACLFEEKGLQEAAFDVMKRDADLVLESEGITRLSHDNLDKLLDMDDLAAEEDSVFKAAMAWAKAECERQGKQAEASEMRTVLGDSLFKIRFSLMPQTDFVKMIGSGGILTDGERVKILERYISHKSSIHPFVDRPRATNTKVYKKRRLVHGTMAEDSISALSLSDSDPDKDNDVTDKLEDVHVNKPADEEDDKSGYTDDWQSGKDFIQTNLMMLECETVTDVTFEVGEEGEIIRAHKFMLASRSCVFFAMFCGPMAESGEIKITDIHPNNFREFLRYLYTGVIALTADNAINLLYCSKKYCVKTLEQEVLEYCRSYICADNACTLLEQACLFEEKDLQEAAFNVIKRDASLVLESEGITTLSHDNLDKLLDMDDLAAEEDSVFKATMAWAKAECERQGKQAEASEMRTVLGDTLFKIRFSLMSQADFVKMVGSGGILTDGERVKILERYISPKSSTHPFVDKPRATNTKVYKIQRLVHGGVGYPLSRSLDALHISCDKPVVLLGIMMYAPANVSQSVFSFLQPLLDSKSVANGSSLTFNVTVVARDPRNKRIGIHHENREVKSVDDQVQIFMSSPVHLAPGERYTISLLIEGSVRCWGSMNAITCLTDPGGEVTWTFAHPQTESRFENSLKEGHISGLIYTLDRNTCT